MKTHTRETARVDSLIDENGQPITLAPDSALGDGLTTTTPIGATGPTGWWRLGLALFATLVLLVLLGAWLTGGSPAPTPPPGATG